MGCCKIDQSRRSLNVERLGDRQESLGIIRHAISCTKWLARWPERVGRTSVQCVRQDERGPAASHSSASPQRSNPTSVSGRAQHSRAGAGHSNMDPLQAKREPKGHAGD